MKNICKVKLLVVVYIVFFCITCVVQGMQGDTEPKPIKSVFEGYKGYENYKNRLLELSRYYLFERERSPDSGKYYHRLSSFEKLIDDIYNNREIKPTVEDYGAKRVALSTREIKQYTPSDEIFTCSDKCDCDPAKIIDEYVKYMRYNQNQYKLNNLPADKYVDHCIKNSKHKKLFITKCLSHAKKKYPYYNQSIIFAILKGHNMLDRIIREESHKFISYAIKDANFLRNLLGYSKVQLGSLKDYKTPFFVLTAVKSGDVVSLMLLERHGIKFEDPELIDVVLESKKSLEEKFACLSFLLDRQINISHKTVNDKLDLSFWQYKNEYNYKARKALLFGCLGSHFECFENIIIDKLKDKVKYEIKKEFGIGYTDIDLHFDVTKMKSLTHKLLELKEPYLNELKECVKEKQREQGVQLFAKIERLLAVKKKIYMTSAPDIYASGLLMFTTTTMSWYLLLRAFFVEVIDLVLLELISEDQDILIKEIDKQINLNYIKGYLDGLQESNKKLEPGLDVRFSQYPLVRNWSKYKEKFERAKLEKIGIKQYRKYLAFSVGFLMLASYTLGVDFSGFALTATISNIGIYLGARLEQFNKESIQKILDTSFERGKTDGIERYEFSEESFFVEPSMQDVVLSGMVGYFKTIFGIISYPKTLFSRFASKYTIRNPERNLSNQIS